MAKVRFAYENLIDLDGISIAASSEEEDLPVSNIAHPFRTYVWRSTDDTSETITIDLLSAYSVLCAAIIAHNLTSGATITYESSNDSGFSTLIADETLTWRSGVIFVFLTSNTARYHRFTFADASNPDGYIEIGRAFLGNYLEPEGRNFHEKYTDGGEDLSLISSAEGGQVFGDEKSEKRKFGFNWTSPITLNNNDKGAFQDFFQTVKTTVSFLLFLDYYLLPNEVYYGRLSARPTFTNQNNYNWWETSIEFEEAL